MSHGTQNAVCLYICRSRSSSAGASVNSVVALSEAQIILPLDENERLLSLQMALKCADLGHVIAALPVHCRCAHCHTCQVK